MKIGILTFHRPVNYGAFLQAFSLSSHLAKRFPDAEIEVIDYIAPKEKKKIYINVLRKVKHEGVLSGFRELKKVKMFRGSLKNLTLSKEYICSNNLNELYEYIDENYDALVIGSDAVFNWNQNGYPTAFIPQYKFKIPVLTYAASVHGLKYLEQPEERIEECGKAFLNMQFVSVRDRCTEDFVKHCAAEVKPSHCCDPTFLLDFDSLYKIKHRSVKEIFDFYSLSNEQKYIVLMLQNEEISQEVYNRYHDEYKIISLFGDNKYSDVFMFDLNPVEWCLVLKNASLVFTNYFHGTLLTLQQANAAMVVDISGYDYPYEGKLYDLMCKRLGLSDMYIKANDIKNEDLRNNFFLCAQKCIEGEYTEHIKNAVKNERETFSVFENAVRQFVIK